MGIVNATPDSFSDAGELPDVEARVARARELVAAGAAIDRRRRRVGVRRPARRAGRGGGRARRAGDRAGRARARRGRLRRHVQAGGRRGGDRGRRAPGQRRLRPARPGAGRALRARRAPALVLMHTRVAPKGTLLDPGFYDDVVADVRDFLAERMAVARGGGRGARAAAARPGPGLRQDAGADGRGAAPARRRCTRSAARCCCAVSRKDFLGAITGAAGARAGRRDAGRGRLGGGRRRARAARARRRRGGRLPRRARGAARRARARRRREGLTPDRYPERASW